MRKLVYLATAVLGLLSATVGALPLRAQASSAADDKAAIKTLYDQFNDAFNRRDVDAIMAVYSPQVFAFDAVPPREYPTWNAYKRDWESLFAMFPGPVSNAISELNITVVGPVAYSRYIDATTFTGKDGSKTHFVVRTTDVLRKEKGKWLIVQEHSSFPVDPATGKADLLSQP